MANVHVGARETLDPAGILVLSVHHPSGTVQRFVPVTDPVTIGRSAGNTLRLDDHMVSRLHARIDREGRAYVLRDCGAKNGTLLNGAAVERQALRSGDEIQIGDTRITVRFDSDEVSVAARPEVFVEGPNEDTGDVADHPNHLASMAELLAGAPDELIVLEDVVGRLVEQFLCDRATVLLVEEDSDRVVVEFSRPPGRGGEASGADPEVVRAALSSERAICLPAPRAPDKIGNPLGASRHLLLLPLVSQGHRIGQMILEREPGRTPFTNSDLLAARVAGAQLALFVRRMI